jgi:amidophosphoribosyltransferase
VLLNVLAHELQENATNYKLDPATIFTAVSGVYRRCRGAYAVVAMIAGYGVLAFRDPYGIRPLIFGRADTDHGYEYMVASESVALDSLGFEVVRDVAPGEAIFIDQDGNFFSRQCAPTASLNPCIFEFVYLARPDSVIDGISVYETRLRMGESLAEKIKRQYRHLDIDVVIPIPDSSRPAAMELSKQLNLSYREGFIKNRYIGRTFIMPGQAIRRKSVQQKLNAIGMEFKGKNVLLVDDSIVRGNTSREIVQMARLSGARKVFFASAAPPVRFPNVYGIDMPTREELIACGRSESEIAREIGCDELIYQDLAALRQDVHSVNPAVVNFEDSCFSGVYVTGDVTQEYLDGVESRRRDGAKMAEAAEESAQLDLGLEMVE